MYIDSIILWCDINFEFDNREFDDGLLQRIPEISYEDDLTDIPLPPDVSNYLVSEVSTNAPYPCFFVCLHPCLNFLFANVILFVVQDDASLMNGNKDPLTFDGMADAEVERRLKVNSVAIFSCYFDL